MPTYRIDLVFVSRREPGTLTDARVIVSDESHERAKAHALRRVEQERPPALAGLVFWFPFSVPVYGEPGGPLEIRPRIGIASGAE